MRDQSPSLRQLVQDLERSGSQGSETARYLHDHGVRLRVRQQPTGARWTLGRGVELHPRYIGSYAATPYAMSLVVHEIRHLQQGILTALSVYGELDAWRAQFSFLMDQRGALADVPGKAEALKELLALPTSWDRSILRSARQLMRQYAGQGYRIDLLPLYPLHRELLYAIARRHPA